MNPFYKILARVVALALLLSLLHDMSRIIVYVMGDFASYKEKAAIQMLEVVSYLSIEGYCTKEELREFIFSTEELHYEKYKEREKELDDSLLLMESSLVK